MARSRHRVRRRRRPRRVGVRVPRRTYLVFSEGARTEPEYVRALKQQPEVHARSSVRISNDTIGITPPLALVRAAIKAIDRAEEENAEIDEVWCLFDVEWPDNHPKLHETVALAKRKTVQIAVSNPSFELWLALHFRDSPGWLDTRAAERLRKSHDGSRDKGVNGTMYMPRRADAADRARGLAQNHEKEGTRFPQDNPSSGMYLLLQAIESEPSVGYSAGARAGSA